MAIILQQIGDETQNIIFLSLFLEINAKFCGLYI